VSLLQKFAIHFVIIDRDSREINETYFVRPARFSGLLLDVQLVKYHYFDD